MNEEELKLIQEMLDNCKKQSIYVDVKAMEKYNALRKLLDNYYKLYSNWNQLMNCVIDLFNTSQDTAYLDVLEKIQEFEKDNNNANTSN